VLVAIRIIDYNVKQHTFTKHPVACVLIYVSLTTTLNNVILLKLCVQAFILLRNKDRNFTRGHQTFGSCKGDLEEGTEFY
jgi:hypothetical protein